MTTDFNQILEPCLENIGKDVEVLLDANVVFDLGAPIYGRNRSLPALGGQTIRLAMSTRADEAASPVGFLVPEVAAIDMASTLLMTQGEVDKFNQEIASAYDEVLNVIFNGWKLAAPSIEDRVVAKPEARTCDAYTVDGLDEFLTDKSFQLITVPFTFNGASYIFGVVGQPAWLGIELSDSAQLDGDTSTAPFSGAADMAVAADMLPASGDTSRVNGASPDAHMMLIDLSGALNAWLTENMANGTLQLVRPSADLQELSSQSTLVVVGPKADLFRKLSVPQCVVAKPVGDGSHPAGEGS